MTQQATEPTRLTSSQPAPRTLGSQVQALLAATLLAEAFPEFTGAYLTFSKHYPGQVNIQAGSLVEVEAWREALGADPSTVCSRKIGRDVELFFETPKFGASVRVYAIELVAAETVPAVAA